MAEEAGYDWIVERFKADTYEAVPARAFVMSRSNDHPGVPYGIAASRLDLAHSQTIQTVPWGGTGIRWEYLPGVLIMVWRSGSWMYRVKFGPKGPNSLPDIHSVERAELGDPAIATWVTIVNNAGGGDWSGPFQVAAENNGDGDTSRQYTGGNHGKDGNVGGGASAKNISLVVLADGAPVESGAMGESENIRVIAINDVMAFNTRSIERFVIRETCSFHFFPGIVGLKKKVEALEAVLIYQDNGPQTFSVGFQTGSLIYYGKNNSRIAFTSVTNSGNKSVNPSVWAVVFQDSANGQLASWMDREFSAGDGRFVRSNWPYIRGGGASNKKFYHAAVISDIGVPLAAGESYEWRGGWAWQQVTTVSAGFDSTLTFNRDENRIFAQSDENGLTAII